MSVRTSQTTNKSGRSEISSNATICSTVCSGQQEMKWNINALHYWPFVKGIPPQRASNAESALLPTHVTVNNVHRTAGFNYNPVQYITVLNTTQKWQELKASRSLNLKRRHKAKVTQMAQLRYEIPINGTASIEWHYMYKVISLYTKIR